MVNIYKWDMVCINFGHVTNNLVLKKLAFIGHHHVWHVTLGKCHNERQELFSNFEIRNLNFKAANDLTELCAQGYSVNKVKTS
jgi:hypothetical protein